MAVVSLSSPATMAAQASVRKRLDFRRPLAHMAGMAKRKQTSLKRPKAPEVQTAEMSRPEFLRWAILASVAVMVVLTASLGAREGASAPIVLGVSFLFAVALIWFGWSLFNSKARRVVFDGERLVDDAGAELCRLDEIEAVERGIALFKPSSGFALLLKTEKPRGWEPGLWWRYGRRIGVGGATPGRAGRNMADAIQGAMTARAVDAMMDKTRGGGQPPSP